MNIHGALREGDTRWQETALRLMDLSYLRDQRLACAGQFATPLVSDCLGDIDMVLHRLPGGHEASVVFARASASTEVPAEAPACAAYVECLAASRLGSKLPMPSGGTEMIAINQRTVFAWASPLLFEPQKVAALIALREEELAERLDEGGVDDFERRSEEQLIEYLRHHLDELNKDETP